jgi:hypothetical protein
MFTEEDAAFAAAKPPERCETAFGQLCRSEGCDAWVHDTETYRPLCLYGFRNLASGQVMQFSTVPDCGGSFDDLRAWLAARCAAGDLFVGFNSVAFDNCILRAILNGQDDPRVLYTIAQNAIAANSGRTRHPCYKAATERSFDLLAVAGATKG